MARIVDAVLDCAYTKDQSFVLDGTLSSYEVARKNIQRSLKHDRLVQILYVYQEPMLAWGFVQAREATEGRRIRPEDFVRQYFAARQVVNRLKKELGASVRVDLVMKNSDNRHRFYRAGVDLIDSHIPECVDQKALEFKLGVSYAETTMKRPFKAKPACSSPLSDFIRNAPSSEKKRVYKQVLERATNRQIRILKQAEACK